MVSRIDEKFVKDFIESSFSILKGAKSSKPILVSLLNTEGFMLYANEELKSMINVPSGSKRIFDLVDDASMSHVTKALSAFKDVEQDTTISINISWREENIIDEDIEYYEWAVSGRAHIAHVILMGVYNTQLQQEYVSEVNNAGRNDKMSVVEFRSLWSMKSGLRVMDATFNKAKEIQKLMHSRQFSLRGTAEEKAKDRAEAVDEDRRPVTESEVNGCRLAFRGASNSPFCIMDAFGSMYFVDFDFDELFFLPGNYVGMMLDSSSHSKLIRTLRDWDSAYAVPVVCSWLNDVQKVPDAVDEYNWYLRKFGRLFVLYGM